MKKNKQNDLSCADPSCEPSLEELSQLGLLEVSGRHDTTANGFVNNAGKLLD